MIGGTLSQIQYNNGSESDTGVPFQRTGLRVQFVLTSASAYKLIVTPCGGTSNVFTGSYSGTITNLVLFNLVLGAWVFISPLLFHYNTDDAATWIHMIGGIVVMSAATAQMWRIAGQISRAALAR